MGSQTKAAARRISGIAKDALQIRTETLRWESTKSTMQPPFPSFFFLTQKAESKASDRSPTLSRRRRRSSSYILYSLPFSLINVPSHVLIYVPSFPFVRVFSARHFPAPRLHSKRASERARVSELTTILPRRKKKKQKNLFAPPFAAAKLEIKRAGQRGGNTRQQQQRLSVGEAQSLGDKTAAPRKTQPSREERNESGIKKNAALVLVELFPLAGRTGRGL